MMISASRATSPTKQLRFKSYASVKKIPHISEYSEEEIGKMWIRQIDMDRLRQDLNEICTGHQERVTG
jgi:hypothetical protein